MGLYAASGDLYSTITAIIRTLPLAPMVLVLLAAAMIAFYATSFDAIVLVASAYSYKNLTSEDEPHMAIKTFWSLSLILLPMVLISVIIQWQTCRPCPSLQHFRSRLSFS